MCINMEKRDENIEMLRAISCIAVVILHVNAWCFQIENLAIHLRNVNVIINTVVRFAVPCFMLITGTYIFRNADKNGWKRFYKNAVKKVIIPTIFFSMLCVIYVVIKGCLDGQMVLQKSLDNWIHGIPFGHMWYMYMLIGLYAAVPILCLIRERVSRFYWEIIGILCIALSVIFYNDNLLSPIWPFCWIQYVGYFILGDFVGGGKKSRRQLRVSVFIGVASLLLMCVYSIKKAYMGIRFDFQPQNILTVFFSISL